MLNSINHQGNANQNQEKIPRHICQNSYYQKRQQVTSFGKSVGKRESSWPLGGNVICAAVWKTVLKRLKKLIEILYGPAFEHQVFI